jgi:hypothetical protein
MEHPLMIATESASSRTPSKELLLRDASVFTIVNGASHSTFWISVVQLGGRSRYFVWQRLGSRGKAYIGELHPLYGFVLRTTASEDHDQIDYVLNKALPHIWDGTPLPEGASVLMAVRCRKCDGRLTHPESIARGLGRRCAEIVGERPGAP